MPSNQQRREAAKRKLERQLERRAQHARRRKQLTIAGSLTGVIIIAGVIALVVVTTGGGESSTTAADSSASASTTSADPTPPMAPLPTPKARPASVHCSYPAQGKAAKANTPPQTDGVPARGTVHVEMATNQGPIGLDLNRAEAPCTVNSFLSLAKQGYFDHTPCHRLTTSGIYVLQCGDPTGTGTGGPGYGFDNEYPSDQFAPNDPALQQPTNYKRGTIAMANTGRPGSNGSQFFLVYKDSPLPPNYTVFGTIDKQGLATVDKVAQAGVAGPDKGAGDGKPQLPVTIQSAATKS